jgi:hypothetical protein
MTSLDRRDVMRLSLLAAAATSLSTTANSRESTPMSHDRAHDFDWLFGSWHVQHLRLKERLMNNTEWVPFDGTCVCQPLMAGMGNVDDNVLNLPEGSYRAVGLRSFNAKTKTWAIWWLDGRNPHLIEVPVLGGFENGVGTFIADDTLREKPIKVRFQWSKITRTSAQWEQAFSPDGGRTWETNWKMQFKRTA